MDPQQFLPKVPENVKFRVLIIGRANAGKTSILQRVCDTTESPHIYRLNSQGERERVQLEATQERGEHNIGHEIVFSSHEGYVFHDSRGFEAGGEDELKTVQEFVRSKSQGRDLWKRLHAIWYCIPMDNDRPSLDLKYFDDICPDKNVPVIAVFTKYDQFRRDIRIKLEDQHRDPSLLNDEIDRIFSEHYLVNLKGSPPFVRLEKMNKHGQRCTGLMEMTADALSGAVALILLAIQKDNLELNIRQAVKWIYNKFTPGFRDTEKVIKACIVAFPTLWYFRRESLDRVDLLEAVMKDNGWAMQSLERLIKNEKGEDYSGKPAMLFSKLRTFVTNPPLSISSDVPHHTMIVLVLILEHVCLHYASSSEPSLEKALDKAYSQYMASKTHHAVIKQLSASPQTYSILQFTEFIFGHRLL